MRTLLFSFLVSALVPLTACNLYFSGGDDDPPCADWGGGSLEQPAELLRNPDTGVCESFGVDYPPFPCDGTCGPCYGTADGTTTTNPETTPSGDPDSSGAPQDQAERAPNPGWGACESYCTGLDELACLGTAGCRGVYGAGIDSNQFQECWATGTEPILVDNCEGLDAYTCSQSDSCIAVHVFNCDGSGEQDPNPDGLVETCSAGAFVACGNEGPSPDGCYGDNDCDPGSHCNAADLCLPPPAGGDCAPGGGGCDVPAVCYGYCEPDVDPGECDGEILCDAIAPTCPVNTTPGIANGCWTGQCISLDLCPSTACSDIVGEAVCIARTDCSPYYIGEGCDCGPEGCVCTTWTYDSCNSSAP